MFLMSCNKSENKTVVLNQISIQPVIPVTPVAPTIAPNFKNYLTSSYELRKTDIWIDFNKFSNSLIGKNYNCGNAFADFNGDGYEDPLMTWSDNTVTRHPIELFINDKSNSNFSVSSSSVSLINNIGVETARKAIVGDFNNDKRPDVFFADHGAEIGSGPFPGSYVSILLSSESGYNFKILDQLLPKNFYHGATSGDFDNDGDLDIFLTTGEFLINDGKANFTVNKNIFQFNQGGVYTSEFIDINKDGFLDLLIGGHTMTNWEMKSNKIFWGNGKVYTESNSADLPNVLGWGVSIDFAYEDLNNDGIKEIIINRSGGSPNALGNGYDNTFYQGYRLQVLKNMGGYKFEDKTADFIESYFDTSDRWIVWIGVSDIDKNGKLDIYDLDKGHNNTGKTIRWEISSDGIFRKKIP